MTLCSTYRGKVFDTMRAPGAALGGSLGSVSAQRECMLGTFSHSPCVSCTSSISGTHGAPPHGHLNLEPSKLDAGPPARLHLISGGPRELPRILFVSSEKDSSDLNNGGSYSRDVPVYRKFRTTPDREIVGSGLGSAREALVTVPDSDQLLLTKRI